MNINEFQSLLHFVNFYEGKQIDSQVMLENRLYVVTVMLENRLYAVTVMLENRLYAVTEM